MKQSLKIGLFLVLTLLMFGISNKMMEKTGKVVLPTYRQERCYLSQDQPDSNLLGNLFHLHANQSCCDMSHADVVQVPGNKSVLPWIAAIYKQYRLSQNPSHAAGQYAPFRFSDPISHYIYELRKIVI